jgi:hypothetical protein
MIFGDFAMVSGWFAMRTTAASLTKRGRSVTERDEASGYACHISSYTRGVLWPSDLQVDLETCSRVPSGGPISAAEAYRDGGEFSAGVDRRCRPPCWPMTAMLRSALYSPERSGSNGLETALAVLRCSLLADTYTDALASPPPHISRLRTDFSTCSMCPCAIKESQAQCRTFKSSVRGWFAEMNMAPCNVPLAAPYPRAMDGGKPRLNPEARGTLPFSMERIDYCRIDCLNRKHPSIRSA